MKRLTLATTALLLATPAFAQVSANECDVRQHLNDESGLDGRVECIEDTGIGSDAAETAADAITEEPGEDQLTAEDIQDADRGVASEEAAEILEDIEDEDDNDV